MENAKKLGTSLLLKLCSNPYVLCAVLILILVGMILTSISMLSLSQQSMDQDAMEEHYTQCTPGQLNTEVFTKEFENAGVFTGMSQTFISVAYKHNIDPVLLAAISFNETGRGTSNAVKKKNNPGGLMNPRTGSLFVYPSLEKGIDAMASNLYRLYISQKLVTISQIGNKYAPVGASNDPNNLNMNWVPNVSQFANQFGGLTMNCEEVNIGSGQFVKPVPKATLTSDYGMRIHPITGEYKFHKGVDLACRIGDSVFAATDGVVKVSNKKGYGGGYGHYIVLDHGDKFTLYGHLTTAIANVGQSVTKGQKIGTCGQTGGADGPHVHFEVQLTFMDQRTDPMPYFGSAK